METMSEDSSDIDRLADIARGVGRGGTRTRRSAVVGEGPSQGFSLDQLKRYQLRLAECWLHDSEKPVLWQGNRNLTDFVLMMWSLSLWN